MNLMLEEILVQQTSIVNKLHATELLWQSRSQGRDSAQTSNEESKKSVKPIGPRAESNEKASTCRSIKRFKTTMFRTMLPTTDLDGSDVNLPHVYLPQHARVC